MSNDQNITHAELDALVEADRKNRAPRTAGQAGIAASFFVAFDYIVRGFLNIDLDPNSANTEMPVIVTAALTTIITYFVSLYMNRKPKSTV